MGKVVLTASEDGFFTDIREGGLGSLFGDGAQQWLDTLPLWQGATDGVTLIADVSAPPEEVFIGQEVPLRLSTITYARAGEEIGTLRFETPLDITARRDVFGAAARPGFAVDLRQDGPEALQVPRFVFLGSSGDDVFSASAAPPATYEVGRFWGRDGADALTGFNGYDILRGGVDDDRLDGGRGDDILFGNRGMDTLTGGRGDDVLSGGLGRDTFVFEDAPTGRDMITDFQVGRDVIAFEAPLDGFEALTLTEEGGDTRITWSQRDAEIVLQAVSPDDLTADSFIFL